MIENYFNNLLEVIKFYPEELTLEFISSLDEKLNNSDIKNLKNRISGEGWTYQFGYIWYTDGKFYISQKDPKYGLHGEKPWELYLKKGTSTYSFSKMIQGIENRRYIPLIFKGKKTNTYSIATYKELCSAPNTVCGIEKLLYYNSKGMLQEILEQTSSTDPDKLSEDIQKYLSEISLRKNDNSNKIYFHCLLELHTVCKIISALEDDSSKKHIYKKLNQYINSDIKKYLRRLDPSLPKINLGKNTISNLNYSLIPAFLEVSKNRNKSLRKFFNVLDAIEKEIKTGHEKILRNSNEFNISAWINENVKKYSTLFPIYASMAIALFIIIDFNMEFRFLAIALPQINLSSLGAMITYGIIISTLYTLSAFVVLTFSDFHLSSIKELLNRVNIRIPIKLRNPLAYFITFLSFYATITLPVLIITNFRENSVYIATATFSLLYIYLAKQKMLGTIRQTRLLEKMLPVISFILIATAFTTTVLNFQIHPLKSCAFIVNNNKLHYYEYVSLNGWERTSNIALLKNETYVINNILTEPQNEHSGINNILPDKSQILTPSIINIENKNMPPQMACPLNLAPPAQNLKNVNLSYLQKLVDKGVVYKLTEYDGVPQFEIYRQNLSDESSQSSTSHFN